LKQFIKITEIIASLEDY